ncbi:MAG: carbohydrate ABC transporter permease, partial [Anaerolineaceae bacterium]|nr:carbohydrate ABC transporter permease [Anaerolineaceae bacterium]
MSGAARSMQLLPNYLLLTIFLLIILLPILGITLSAFKTDAEIIAGPFSLPSEWSLDAFKRAWTVGHFNQYFRSSTIVSTAVVIASTVLSILSGYAFGVMRFPLQRLVYFVMLIGFMVPFEAVVIPLYHIMNRFGLTDSYWALILPQIGQSISFGTLWMTSTFLSMPQELIDASALDGCNRWQSLWRVLFPISKPAVFTLVVLFFMWTWNEFLLALVMVQQESLRTLPVGLAFFQGRYTSD